MNPDTVGQSSSKFPTRSKSDSLHRFKEPGGDLRPWLHKGREPLGKDFSSAVRITAEELADQEMKDAPLDFHKGHHVRFADTGCGFVMTLERKVDNKKKGTLRQRQLLRELLEALSAPRATLQEGREGMTALSTRDSSCA